MRYASLEAGDESLIERATRIACKLYGIVRSDHEDVRHEICTGLLRARRRFDPARGVPFGGYAWNWMRGAATRWISKSTGISPSEWKRGIRRPHSFGEGEAFDVGRIDDPSAGLEAREALDEALAPLNQLGGLLKRVHAAIYLKGATVPQVAKTLGLDCRVVRRLKVQADLIVRSSARRRGQVDDLKRPDIAETEVQMDRSAKLDADLLQIRDEVELLAREFGGVFDGATIRKHLRTRRALFEAGDRATASTILSDAKRLHRLQSTLIKIDLQLLARRRETNANQRQMRLFID